MISVSFHECSVFQCSPWVFTTSQQCKHGTCESYFNGENVPQVGVNLRGSNATM